MIVYIGRHLVSNHPSTKVNHISHTTSRCLYLYPVYLIQSRIYEKVSHVVYPLHSHTIWTYLTTSHWHLILSCLQYPHNSWRVCYQSRPYMPQAWHLAEHENLELCDGSPCATMPLASITVMIGFGNVQSRSSMVWGFLVSCTSRRNKWWGINGSHSCKLTKEILESHHSDWKWSWTNNDHVEDGPDDSSVASFVSPWILLRVKCEGKWQSFSVCVLRIILGSSSQA
jgi:hypothetical protein